MEANLKYQNVYALMAVEEQSGWQVGTNELEKVYDTVGYIVSKACLIGKTTKQIGNNVIEEYEVVFPYKNLEDLTDKNTPRLNLDGECMNSDKVTNIFATYESAKETANKLNRELRSRSVVSYRGNEEKWIEKVNAAYRSFDATLARYIEVEETILALSDDMEVSQEPKNQGPKLLELKI